MIINRTYEQARLDAIHILSAYENFPTTITIKPRVVDGKTEWVLEYEENYEKEREGEK